MVHLSHCCRCTFTIHDTGLVALPGYKNIFSCLRCHADTALICNVHHLSNTPHSSNWWLSDSTLQNKLSNAHCCRVKPAKQLSKLLVCWLSYAVVYTVRMTACTCNHRLIPCLRQVASQFVASAPLPWRLVHTCACNSMTTGAGTKITTCTLTHVTRCCLGFT